MVAVLSEERKQALYEEAQVFEGLIWYRRQAATDPDLQAPEVLEMREHLAGRFVRGMHYLQHRKELGTGSLHQLLKREGRTATEALEAMSFAVAVMQLKKDRKRKIREAGHLRITGEAK